MLWDSEPPLSDVLKARGLWADKKLGQHFLLDRNITDKIAGLAAPLEGIHVAEIGPGPGGLTRSLLDAGAQVLAIETDPRFVDLLQNLQSDRLQVSHADALKFDIAKALPAPRKIIANLPYNVGTKMLINWVSAQPIFWEQMVLMFQKEVAERIVASCGDKAYGRLAVLCQSVAECRIAFDLPASAFTPPPKVDSAVVVLQPLEKPYENLKALGEVTQAAFGQRRKMLRRSLRNLAQKHGFSIDLWLTDCDINPASRPETLTVEEFQKLANRLLKL